MLMQSVARMALGTEREDLLRLCLEDSPDGIAVFDIQMRYIAASQSYLKAMGIADRPVIGHCHYDLFPNLPDSWRAANERCLAGSVEHGEAETFAAANGSIEYWNWRIHPWREAGGEVGGLVLSIRIVTAEVLRTRGAEVVHAAMESTAAGLVVIDSATGKVMFANRAFAEMHRIPATELTGLPVLDTCDPADRDRHAALLAVMGQDGSCSFECKRRRADGSTFMSLSTIAPVRRTDGGPACRVGTVIDITQQKQEEAARFSAEEHLLELVQLGPGVLYRARVTADKIELVHVLGDAGRIAGSGDGGSSTVSALLQHPDSVKLLRRVAAGGGSDSGTAGLALVRPGAPVRWLRNAVRVTRRSDGVAEVAGYLTDITAETQEQLHGQRAAALVGLGEMATGMAHELNQPLATISFAAQNAAIYLQQGEAGLPEVSGKLGKIAAEARRAAKMIDRMRAFGRSSPQGMQPVSWQEVLESAIELAKPGNSGCEVRNELPAGLPMVSAMRILLEEVTANLLRNAADAYDTSGISGGKLITVTGREDHGRVVVRVADHAGGIPPEVLPRIFEPFFTTKAPGKGAGLGLSLSYGTVLDMGGSLTAHNEDGGAVFEIELPVAGRQAGLRSTGA